MGDGLGNAGHAEDEVGEGGGEAGVEGAEALAGGLHSGSFTPVDDERSAEGCTRQGSELGAVRC